MLFLHTHANIFEAIMLISFGCAWPVSIYKTLKSKTALGKSTYFLFIILAGYVAGILFEVFGAMDNVLYLYVLNALMVLADIILTLYYKTVNAHQEKI